jgi:hypothetical protein
MKIERKFTTAGQSPFDAVEWTTRSSKIANPDGSVVFEMADAEVPRGWSQLATDIMVSKYFRKAGVPQTQDPFALPGTSRVYIECSRDRTITLAAQREMQAALPCDPVYTLESDHSPFLSQPERLAQLLGGL